MLDMISAQAQASPRPWHSSGFHDTMTNLKALPYARGMAEFCAMLQYGRGSPSVMVCMSRCI